MPKERARIIIECSERFRDRIMEEKLARGQSVKDMVVTALERYFARPQPTAPGQKPVVIQPPAEGGDQEPVLLGFLTPDLDLIKKQNRTNDEEWQWVRLCLRHMRTMPPSRHATLKELIQGDLRYFKIRGKERTRQPEVSNAKTRKR